MQEANVIILGFKPGMARSILGQPGVRQSVSGKLVISLLAGVSTDTVQDYISESDKELNLPAVWVAKAIPNLAARYQQSMTVLEKPPPEFPSHYIDYLEWIFGMVGKVKFLDSSLVDVGSVLVTTCIATLTVPLDGILDGSVIEGFRRQDALALVRQSVMGLGVLLSNGSHPAVLREQVSSPKGCTIQTVVAVERQGVRAAFTDALLQGTHHLSTISQK
ncbi:pyrroline-5-carboxylate reductase [Colletotrichum limetticola]|uniref:Pyrroline-5-carboxylate reductase n=1 Tax=Colletotrichum limetticola TaxID=1209924 RepID=A0ABQ9P875_9PEZI|nr:pyrroline-5-carboxylate reductase [Colletotrichum limetticola]